jgi:hypothetical protein
VYALDHLRGGGEPGRPWYAAGRRLDKINSFTDFLSCAHHLIDIGVADPERTPRVSRRFRRPRLVQVQEASLFYALSDNR